MAKQFGVDSPEIEKLNTLFSSLVDRNPTSLDAFKKLKGRTSGILPSGDCIWEELAARQITVVEETRQSPPAIEDSFKVFQQNLACYASSGTLKECLLNERGDHFYSSPWHTDIAKTIDNWENLCSSASLPNLAEERLLTKGDKIIKHESVATPALELREVRQYERFVSTANDTNFL